MGCLCIYRNKNKGIQPIPICKDNKIYTNIPHIKLVSLVSNSSKQSDNEYLRCFICTRYFKTSQNLNSHFWCYTKDVEEDKLIYINKQSIR